ncbi:MAG: hypothetical protein M5R36_17980 [Deltaproteobacteria bacterium]|nr:hypothetical protein [Deltaproteobacteria bacterium]
MMSEKMIFLLMCFPAVLSATLSLGCGCDDDDDDNDDADDDDMDDDADDDTTGDDDADDDTPCDGYDVVIDGETDLGAGNVSMWTARLLIADNGDITGVIEPDEDEPDPYDVTGFRHDETSGEIDGSFQTPSGMAEACAEANVFAHVGFTVTDGEFGGDVSYYCGSVDAENLIGSIRPATGSVTCGDFAA